MHNRSYWVELDKDILNHNIRQYKTIVGNAQLAFVVKGNAYGHGIREMIQLTKDNHLIHWYCTFSLSEALYIRSLGVAKPILVLGLIDRDPSLAFQQHIDLTIHDTYLLHMIAAAAQKSKHKAHVHIKIDTGLSRFGFLPDEAYSIIQHIGTYPELVLNGIYTHFASTVQSDQTYTLQQIASFQQVLTSLYQQGINIPYRHSHASAATLRHALGHSNMVRVGAGIYGLWASEDLQYEAERQHTIKLQQVATLKTVIQSIRVVTQGTYIGYGCTRIAHTDMRIGILPIGYADGYTRRLSNIGNVYVDGRYAPIIGKIAMNVTIIDITHIPTAHIGSEVTVMGNIENLTALALARQIESDNPREIIAAIPPHAERTVVTDTINRYTSITSHYAHI